MSAATLAYTLKTGESYVYLMGRWSAPWGNEIRVGILEALMATVFSGVMLLSLYGGMHHIFEDCDDEKSNLYFTMISLLMSSLFALIYTNDIFTGYVFVEINTIASCALVMLKSSGKTLVATTKYLIMSLLGSGLFLMGIVTLYGITGELLMESIAVKVRDIYAAGTYRIPLTVIVGLFSIGLAVKSALFPFHSWLPDAHGNATASSSAILSGLVLKGYIILLIKIFCRVIGLDIIAADKASNFLFAFGVLAMICGSISALKEKDLKRMLAYSSVAQVGYIYVGIGLNSDAGMLAACIQIIAHALTKPMLFCASGGFMDVSGGSKSMSDITGAGRRDKLGGIAFTVGALSMIGIPFFAGFVTKVNLTTAAVSLGGHRMPIALIAIAVSTLLNALYYVPVIFNLYSKRTDGKFEGVKADYHWEYVFAMVVFIILNLCFGTFSEPIVGAIRDGLAMFGM
jgi:multicomponent Na+:H+ antiporter subunit D